MNRREALAAGVLAVGGGATGASNREEATQKLPQLIDERLSNVVNLRALKDNEYGYTSSVVSSRLDPDILYLATGCHRGNMVMISNKPQYSYDDSIVWRRGDYFYVRIGEGAVENIEGWRGKEGWGLLPGDLAHCMAYPLVEKDGEFYKVPVSWGECSKHSLVRRNTEALKKCLSHYKEMKNILGFSSLLSCFVTDEDLKCLEEIVNV